MSVIYMSLKGQPSSGGPMVAAYRLAQGFQKREHKVIYDAPERADVCLAIIESGKLLRKVNAKKIVVRLDGAYFRGYWNGSKGREWRPDMTALHTAVKRDIENVGHIVYQSQFSKDLIDSEISKRDTDYSIINNGVDTQIFTPKKRENDGFINLFHHGVMRNDYLMDTLIGVYKLLKNSGFRLVLVGSMDAECKTIYEKDKDDGIKYLGPVPNSKLPEMFKYADIGLYPRMGSSSDNCVVECLSSGVPVAIPSFGGNAEFLMGSQNAGIIVESKNWEYGEKYTENFAKKVVECMMKDLDGFKLGARNWAVKNLGIDAMIEKYIKAMGIK